MIHIYCGEGKGKTTAAIGLAVRAAGAGKKVYLARFLKAYSSELESLAKIPNITVAPYPAKMKFSFLMTPEEKEEQRAFAAGILSAAFDSGADVIVLDECCGALSAGILDLPSVLEKLGTLTEQQEAVLTGRNPPQDLCAMADYITSMEKRVHPFDKGIRARKGIEF